MSTTPRAPAHGEHTTHGVPAGYTSLTPFIVVEPAAQALEFYRDVFGATVLSRMPGAPREDGSETISHAELDFGHGILQLADPMPGLRAQDAEHVSGSICLYVPDVDAVFAAAVARGATVVEPPSDFVSGDRYATVLDPFHRRWAVMTRVEDLSRAASEARVNAWLAQYLAGPGTDPETSP
ncbi:VOC family protein [Zafaria sp. Z1313]|uniref:VOC family protein n=1 Tax=unclassified Zafaria TaxID=2828765 RepID=UPI002E773C9C|nr:VOC family protein [Zafaria sp. J156]MEE1622370.1 VOC family protein [Zafaria sp. J156]